MSLYNPPRPSHPAGWTSLGGRCQCLCHRQSGVQHFMACCSPRRPAKAMSARQGQDPKGLGATPASAVGEADLPETSSSGD